MGSSYLNTQLVPALSQSSCSSSSDLIENHSPSFREGLSSRASIPSARTGPCLDNSFVPAVSQVPSSSSSDLRDDRSSSFRESLSSRASIPSARTTEPFPGFGFKRDRPTPFYEISSPQASVPPARAPSFLDTETAPISSPWQPQPWARLSLPLLCCRQLLFQLPTILSLLSPLPILPSLRGLNLSPHLNHFDLPVLPQL